MAKKDVIFLSIVRTTGAGKCLQLHFFVFRLEQIQMSEFEAEVYEKFSSRVHRQVQSLRVLLESMQAKGKERNWVRHQASGDLDDAKLIEGLTGEKNIYKKRADQEPDVSIHSTMELL